MVQKFQVEGSAYLMLGLALLILPVSWLICALIAMAVHESFHCLAARIMDVPVFRLRIHMGGCSMETGSMSRKQEIICAAAGPVGSLLLCLLIRVVPRIALCALVQGVWNLLPMGDLDGGRIVRCMAGERVHRIAGWVTALVLLIGCIRLVSRRGLGLECLIFWGIACRNLLLQKIPCKPGKLALQ